MRLRCVFLLVPVVFLTVALDFNQASDVAANLRTAPGSFTAYKSTEVSRMLLTASDDAKEGQERAAIPLLSKIAELASKISPSTSSVANWLWLQSKTSPKDVWNALHLGETAATRLDDNPKFWQWLQYVNMFRAKKGNHWFSDGDVFEILAKTTPQADLAVILQALRAVPGMKNAATILQQYLFASASSATRRWMNEVWLQAGESPQNVYTILRLSETPLEANRKFVQWFRFTDTYRAKVGESSYSDRQTLEILMETRPWTAEEDLAAFFLSIKKISGLKKVGGSLETHLFRIWMETWEPKNVATVLGIRDSVSKVSKRDPRFEILKTFTLQYAAEKSGTATMEKVKELFANNNPTAVIEAAVKVS